MKNTITDFIQNQIWGHIQGIVNTACLVTLFIIISKILDNAFIAPNLPNFNESMKSLMTAIDNTVDLFWDATDIWDIGIFFITLAEITVRYIFF